MDLWERVWGLGVGFGVWSWGNLLRANEAMADAVCVMSGTHLCSGEAPSHRTRVSIMMGRRKPRSPRRSYCLAPTL